MNAVGIDVSKGKSMVAALCPTGEVLIEPLEVAHTPSELKDLAIRLKNLGTETKVVMEHTGRYYEPVAQVLSNCGIFISAINPALIRNYGNNSLRRVKTDKKDALKIAKYGLDNWYDLREYSPMEQIRQKLKTLNTQLELYSKTKTSLKNNLIALLDQTYPKVNTLFESPVRSDGSQKWVDFAYTFWHVDCVTSMSEKSFVERYQKWCKTHKYDFSHKKAINVYAQSQNQITMLSKNETTKFLIKESIKGLNSVSHTVESLQNQMHNLTKLLPEYPVVMNMYGVGIATGIRLIAEIGDVRRFSHRGALVAYAGVDPQPAQSGKQNPKSNPISRKGSSNLRKTLYQIMSCYLRTMPENEAVYHFLDKKRSEGKPYFVYMTAGANKFLRIYYARIKEYFAHLEIIT